MSIHIHLQPNAVVTEEAYYWDAKNNTTVSLAKIVGAMFSDKVMDEVEGALKR
jgi:hypothetical protein